jgi:hypothetical protein
MALPGAGPAYVPGARRGRGGRSTNGLSFEEAARSAGAVLRSIPWQPGGVGVGVRPPTASGVVPASVVTVAPRPGPSESAGAVFAKVRWTGQEVAEEGVFSPLSTKAVFDRFRWE